MTVAAVVGSRNFTDYLLLAETLDAVPLSRVVSGGARGADTMAIEYAKRKGIPYTEYPADWAVYGRAARFIRNKQIVDSGVDIVIAFWNGFSSGTADTINYANKQNKKVYIIYYDSD